MLGLQRVLKPQMQARHGGHPGGLAPHGPASASLRVEVERDDQEQGAILPAVQLDLQSLLP